MREPRMDKETRVIELAETGNICRSLKRIKNSPNGHERERWKMAIYHAMQMAGCWREELEKVRIAFNLP